MNANPIELIPIVSIAGGFAIAALAIVGGMMRSSSKRRQFEQSRREIAAYVAEGSMTPEEGERLLTAESKSMKNA